MSNRNPPSKNKPAAISRIPVSGGGNALTQEEKIVGKTLQKHVRLTA
ncbi:MAG: hypothetical protein LJE84_00060 [Gammaproteobacteria bacterium]|nr:hypothetical protein [Gammaproteobacteria bacterium]